MDAIKYIIFGFILACSAVQAINPRILWRFSRWQYKNPEANEPSRAGFTLQRIIGVIVFVFALIIFVVALQSH